MADQPLDFTGRVAVVTGAGRGIGRGHAQLLAARGARVIINDLGTRMTGDGADASIAQAAAAGITTAGGIAEADTSDISTEEGAAALVEHAIDAFGRIDILINNAGIFGTDDFPQIDLELMRRMHAVHVGGSFLVTRAAWNHMAAAGYGRVVLTTSTSALGAGDTISYTTAKAGVLGLGRALAQAGIPLGIKVNLVAPMALTRMMISGMGAAETPPEDPQRAPALVAPLVALLCHEWCPVTGETFMAGMRRVSRLFIAETRGYTHPGTDLTPETVRDQWETIVSPDVYNIVPGTTAWSGINRTYLAQAPEPAADRAES